MNPNDSTCLIPLVGVKIELKLCNEETVTLYTLFLDNMYSS